MVQWLSLYIFLRCLNEFSNLAEFLIVVRTTDDFRDRLSVVLDTGRKNVYARWTSLT